MVSIVKNNHDEGFIVIHLYDNKITINNVMSVDECKFMGKIIMLYCEQDTYCYINKLKHISSSLISTYNENMYIDYIERLLNTSDDVIYVRGKYFNCASEYIKNIGSNKYDKYSIVGIKFEEHEYDKVDTNTNKSYLESFIDYIYSYFDGYIKDSDTKISSKTANPKNDIEGAKTLDDIKWSMMEAKKADSFVEGDDKLDVTFRKIFDINESKTVGKASESESTEKTVSDGKEKTVDELKNKKIPMSLETIQKKLDEISKELFKVCSSGMYIYIMSNCISLFNNPDKWSELDDVVVLKCKDNMNELLHKVDYINSKGDVRFDFLVSKESVEFIQYLIDNVLVSINTLKSLLPDKFDMTGCKPSIPLKSMIFCDIKDMTNN